MEINQVVSESEVSIDTFRRWTVPVLQQFLRIRNLRFTGRKEELVALAYSASVMKIGPVTTKEDEGKTRALQYADKLNTPEGKLPDPCVDLEDGWLRESEGIAKWPPTMYHDISNFLTCSREGKSLSDRLMRDYKEGKAYSYFSSGWLKEILYHDITATSPYCFLMAECTPSMRVNDIPHNCWVCINKKSGEIYSAYCTCFAGLGETCNHVAAMLFKVDYAWQWGVNQKACTSKPCNWKTPSGKKMTVAPKKLSDMKIMKPHYSKGGCMYVYGLPVPHTILTFLTCYEMCKEFLNDCFLPFYDSLSRILSSGMIYFNLGNKRQEIYKVITILGYLKSLFAFTVMYKICRYFKNLRINSAFDICFKQPINPVSKQLFRPTTSRPTLKTISNALSSACPSAAVFQYVHYNLDAPSCNPCSDFNVFKTETVVTSEEIALPKNLPSLAESCTTVTEILGKIDFNEKEQNLIVSSTLGQSSNPEWMNQRLGRITSSNMHSVYTKMMSIKKCSVQADTRPLVSSLMGYRSISENIPSLKYGRTMESVARTKYINIMKQKKHQNFCVKETGLHVRGFLGASPDGMVNCSCCGSGVLEIKCPISISHTTPSSDNLPYLQKDGCHMKLKPNSPYYTQVQGHMALTNTQWCDFFIFTKHGHLLERVLFNNNFWSTVQVNLQNFFEEYLAPELLTKQIKFALNDQTRTGDETIKRPVRRKILITKKSGEKGLNLNR